MAVKIDFSKIQMYTDITRQNAVIVNARKQTANDLYTKGQGIAFHALALKIYNGEGEQEFNDEEVTLIKNYAEQMCTPQFIDAINELCNNTKTE